MKLESIDLMSVEKELQDRINNLEKSSKNLLADDPSKKVFDELITFLKTFYDTIIRIKESHSLNSNFSYKESQILSLSDIPSSFINNIQLLSKKLHVSVHTIINVLMSEVEINVNLEESDKLIVDFNYDILKKKFLKSKIEIFLSNKEYLEVRKKDLDESDILFSFREIEILIFKDITEEDFQNHIGSINNCKIVFIPKNIPKLLIYAKTQNIDSITIYESLDDVYDAIFIFS